MIKLPREILRSFLVAKRDSSIGDGSKASSELLLSVVVVDRGCIRYFERLK